MYDAWWKCMIISESCNYKLGRLDKKTETQKLTYARTNELTKWTLERGTFGSPRWKHIQTDSGLVTLWTQLVFVQLVRSPRYNNKILLVPECDAWLGPEMERRKVSTGGESVKNNHESDQKEVSWIFVKEPINIRQQNQTISVSSKFLTCTLQPMTVVSDLCTK